MRSLYRVGILLLVFSGCSSKVSDDSLISVDYLLSTLGSYHEGEEVRVRGYLARRKEGQVFLYPNKSYSDIDGRHLWRSALYIADLSGNVNANCLNNYVMAKGVLGVYSGNVVMVSSSLVETLSKNSIVCNK